MNFDYDSRAANLRPLVAIDNQDDRRELWRLLSFPGFTDRHRLAFVRWCCSNSNSKMVTNKPALKDGLYPVQEAINDMGMLVIQMNLNMSKALAELTRRVRRL